MLETPRTDAIRKRLDGCSTGTATVSAALLIAEMLERIAIALEREAKE